MERFTHNYLLKYTRLTIKQPLFEHQYKRQCILEKSETMNQVFLVIPLYKYTDNLL